MQAEMQTTTYLTLKGEDIVKHAMGYALSIVFLNALWNVKIYNK